MLQDQQFLTNSRTEPNSTERAASNEPTDAWSPWKRSIRNGAIY